jgi:multidrug resistance efflux pump
MIRLADMSGFHQGSQFFLHRPSPAAGAFIITLLVIIAGALVWSTQAQMDDVVKVTALIRPSDAISLLRAGAAGEVVQKTYTHDSPVLAGDMLLRIDVSSDILELDNSDKLMARIRNNTAVYNALLETIRSGGNRAPRNNEEAYVRCEAFLTAKREMESRIEGMQININLEYALPEYLRTRKTIEDMERELEQVQLQLELWEYNQMIGVLDTLQILLQNQETLERRIADLEQNIRNAALYAPISGRISEIRRLNTGDRVMAGEEIIHIIPEHEGGLKAELYVDPAYIARIKLGQTVHLRFPGLPPSKFGKLDAVITLIPADYTTGGAGAAAFVVEARIDNPRLTGSNGEVISLRPGIGAEGRIIIDHDTVLSMILRKLDFIGS